MTKTLPPYGDIYLGDNPWAVRSDEIIMYCSGRNTSGVLYGTDVDTDDAVLAASSDATTVGLWVVPAGAFVMAMYANTADSWGADSDAVQITVGDTAGADTWFTDTLLGPAATDADNVFKTNALSPPAGKFYDTGGTISASFPLTTTAIATGLTKFVLVYSMAR